MGGNIMLGTITNTGTILAGSIYMCTGFLADFLTTDLLTVISIVGGFSLPAQGFRS